MNRVARSISFSEKDLTRILKTILWIIPIPALIIAAINFYTGRPLVSMIVLTIPIFCGISYMLLTSGMFRISVYLIIVVISFIVTVSSIFGNGIHENSIVAFPVIVWLSSFLLSSRGVIISTLIVIISLTIIIVGEAYGLYPATPTVPAKLADIIAVSSILILNIAVTYFLTSFLRNSVRGAYDEVEAQQKIEHEIEENLTLKSKLLREVHHRVKNNLSLINSLIALENPERDRVDFDLLQSRIQAIARVHDPLFQSMDYSEVEMQPYLEKLVMGFSGTSLIPAQLLKISIENRKLNIEKAIPVALILHELVNQFEMGSDSKLQIELVFNGNRAELICSAESELKLGVKTEMHLINLMKDELSAHMIISKNRFEISFEVDPTSPSG